MKIRGYRIELGEAEALLRGCAGVRDAVVLALGEGGRAPAGRLRAVGEGEPLSWTELRHRMLQHAPDYMVPQAWVAIQQWPLTVNGKLDRRALPAPEAGRDESLEYVAPRTPTEEILAGIWQQVLGVQRVGIHDNFFALGGHSLMATRVATRMRSTFQIELPLRRLFESPTVFALAQEVEQLRFAGATTGIPPVTPVHQDGMVPLSYGQQRLWFLDQLEPGTAAYNIPFSVQLTGALDIQALERALNEIVQRHEVLRTSFELRPEGAVQIVHPGWQGALQSIDLTEIQGDFQKIMLRDLAAQEAAAPFDLRSGPLLRARLLRLNDNQHVLLLTLHHIVSDGWSISILVREMQQIYRTFAAGASSPLPSLRVQYADYSRWQRKWLTETVLQEQVGYWRQALEGLSDLRLPTDRPRPSVMSRQAASIPVQVPASVVIQARVLAAREGATLFMVLVAALQVVLGRRAGQRDVGIGTSIANRRSADIESLIGFFVNTLVLRTKIEPHLSPRELLSQVRETCLDAYAHQDIPFELLIEKLSPERDLTRNPLFQTIFVLQNAPFEQLQMSELRLAPLESRQAAAKFDLEFTLHEATKGDLVGEVVYSTELFEFLTARHIADEWTRCFTWMVEQPDRPLSEFSLLSDAEHRQIVRGWNETCQKYAFACLHHLIEEQVARTPAAIALNYEGRSLSYQEMNERANQLAHYLRRLGVGPEIRVGVILDRSFELVVSILAILKAGGVYVPLNSEYPDERLEFMVSDARIETLIGSHRQFENLAFYGGNRFAFPLDDPASPFCRH